MRSAYDSQGYIMSVCVSTDGPLTGVFFPTSSGEPHPLSPHNEHSRSTHRQ